MYPEDLSYTAEHEWVRTDGTDSVVGITQYAQEALGDVVYVSLPAVGSRVEAGAVCGEVESTKSVSDVYSPLSGEVVAVNETLTDAPEAINTDPYGAGWLFRLAADPESAALLTAADYQALLPD